MEEIAFTETLASGSIGFTEPGRPVDPTRVAVRVIGDPFKPVQTSRAIATVDLPEFGIQAGNVLVLMKLDAIDCDDVFMLADFRLVRVQHWFSGGQARITDETGQWNFCRYRI